MTSNRLVQQGFSTVELLITLIIASIFLFAGYQLYIQVTRDGADAEKTARLSNLVYERMKQKAANMTASNPSGCPGTSVENTTAAPETITGIGSVTIKSIVTCPYGTSGSDLTDVFLIKIEASYNDAGVVKKVEHATYAN